MAVLLYYPLVNPPVEVVHQALLYWDGVASVVPTDPEIRETAVAQSLKELEQRQLYIPVTYGRDSLSRLSDPVDMPLVHPFDHASVVLVEELRRLAASAQPPRPASPPEAFLYLTKINRRLQTELLTLGLATRCPGEQSRLAVAKEVQELVVGVTVREIARHATERRLFPYTDSVRAQRLALRPAAASRALAWEMELGKLLPVPAADTRLTDVLAFREKYADERLRLMRALHRLLGDLRRDYEHPADVVAQLRVELEQALADYRSAARGSRLVWVHRSVTVTVAVAASAGGSLLLPNLGWFLGVVGGYALNVATREIRPVWQRQHDHDFSYLHRVQAELS
ncbi:hypothetical protein ACPCVO_35160 [Streptomyces umbrinus]|uniref:hypothetical protein n=1 Tax=Streptomyces umbrinus TaxID=67370 RepID=UPI003C2FC652